jgi:hypothetical protein
VISARFSSARWICQKPSRTNNASTTIVSTVPNQDGLNSRVPRRIATIYTAPGAGRNAAGAATVIRATFLPFITGPGGRHRLRLIPTPSLHFAHAEPSMPIIKILIIACLIAIVVSLGSGMFYLVNDKGGSKKMVTALTVRVALSIALFILLFIAWSQGLLQPHGMGR